MWITSRKVRRTYGSWNIIKIRKKPSKLSSFNCREVIEPYVRQRPTATQLPDQTIDSYALWCYPKHKPSIIATIIIIIAVNKKKNGPRLRRSSLLAPNSSHHLADLQQFKCTTAHLTQLQHLSIIPSSMLIYHTRTFQKHWKYLPTLFENTFFLITIFRKNQQILKI